MNSPLPIPSQLPLSPELTISLLSVSMVFWTLHINRILHVFFCVWLLTTQHNVFKVQPRCIMYQYIIPFYS